MFVEDLLHQLLQYGKPCLWCTKADSNALAFYVSCEQGVCKVPEEPLDTHILMDEMTDNLYILADAHLTCDGQIPFMGKTPTFRSNLVYATRPEDRATKKTLQQNYPRRQ